MKPISHDISSQAGSRSHCCWLWGNRCLNNGDLWWFKPDGLKRFLLSPILKLLGPRMPGLLRCILKSSLGLPRTWGPVRKLAGFMRGDLSSPMHSCGLGMRTKGERLFIASVIKASVTLDEDGFAKFKMIGTFSCWFSGHSNCSPCKPSLGGLGVLKRSPIAFNIWGGGMFWSFFWWSRLL